MACTPLNIQRGLFFTTTAWSNAPSASFDGKTLTLTVGGANPGLSVQQGPHSIFHRTIANRTVRYQVLGTPVKFLVILDSEQGAVGTRAVSLVNFTTWTEVPILSVLASQAVAPPVVNPSPGNAAVFLVYGQSGTEQIGVAIYRSDDGAVLGALGAPISPTGQTVGEATATQLRIHFNTANQSHTAAFPLPLGQSHITPSLQTFADTVVGGGPFTPETKQFRITNSGTDCLTVTAVGNTAPFSVQSTSAPLPASLGKNERLTVTVAFTPTAPGTFNAIALPVSLTPANGDQALVCKGKALPAMPKVSFSATTLNFGVLPVGTPAPPQTLRVTNTGSLPLRVEIAPLSASGFACAGFNGTLDPGETQGIAIRFTPPMRGAQSARLSVTTNAAGSPHTIRLAGVGGWRAPVDLSSAGQSAFSPQVAVDGQGNVVAVWYCFNGNRHIVQSAGRPVGGAWQAPVDLSSANQDARDPQVAVDGQGNAVAVWSCSDGTNRFVQSAGRPVGGAWQAPVDLSSAGQSVRWPQVVVDGQGNVVAVWSHFNGTNWIVQSAIRPAGGAWQAPVDLSSAGQNARFTRFAVDAQGNAVAVWSRSDGTHLIVQSAGRPVGGAWQAPVDLSSAGQNASSPQVAVDGQGNAVAVWSRSDGTHLIVQSAGRPVGGAWQAPVDLSSAGQNASSPQVAVDGQGNAVAVWSRSNGTHTNDIVQGAIRPAGGAWQAPVDLSSAGQNASEPQVAVDGQGNAVAVWSRSDGTHTNDIVQGAIRPAGGAWQAPVDLSSAGQNTSFLPQVAVDGQGNAVAVWSRSNGTNEIVQSAATT